MTERGLGTWVLKDPCKDSLSPSPTSSLSDKQNNDGVRSKAHIKATWRQTQSGSEGQEEKKRMRGVRRRLLQLTFFTKEEKAREVDEGAYCWIGFYTLPGCPRPRGTPCICNLCTNKFVLNAKQSVLVTQSLGLVFAMLPVQFLANGMSLLP